MSKVISSCNDYLDCIEKDKLIKAQILKRGIVCKEKGRIIRYAGGFCIVFPYMLANKTKHALRFWTASIDDIRDRSRIISEELKNLSLPYFVNFQFIDEAIQTSTNCEPAVLMDWVDAKTLKGYISSHLNEADLNKLADNFLTMVNELHKHEISHGDLQHDNIMVKTDGSLILVDYDSMYLPQLKGRKDIIKGLDGYQHPNRSKLKYLSEKTDYFSELVIFLSLKALAEDQNLWKKLQMQDSKYLLFNKNDFLDKENSEIFKYLLRNPNLRPLAEKLIEYIDTPDITQLSPFTETITSAPSIGMDEIRNKWQDNGYKKTIVDKAKMISDITKKF